MSFKLKTIRWLVVLLLLTACVARTVSAKDADGDMHMLVFLNTLQSGDDKCSVLTQDERTRVDGLANYGLQKLKLSASKKRKMAEDLRTAAVDCEMAKKFATLFRELGPSQGTPDQDKDVMDVGELKNQLAKVMSTLPKGRLTAISGCWQGKLDKWTLRLCFGSGGDDVAVQLTDSKGNACELPAGQARRREGGVYLYAFSQSGKCSDGRIIQHMEAMCSGDSTPAMSCFASVYVRANLGFGESEAEDASPLGGKVTVTRVRPQ